MHHSPDLELSAIVVCRNDEERIGHLIRRLATHLRALHCHAEIIVVDECSGDNSLPLLALLRRDLPELKVLAGVPAGRGFARGAEVAQGRDVLLLDARSEAPLSSLGLGLSRLAEGLDAFAVHGRFLVARRAGVLRALGALAHRRDAHDLEHRFLRRARLAGLRVEVVGKTVAPATPWRKLRQAILMPLAQRAWW